uniref:SAC domain-containing protein n=1 Tax=Setaria digitata TaxID=48799 RepID=A0A915PWV9_9BILA
MSRLWHLSVFETPTNFYIVGSDVSKTRYRLLKIDRLRRESLNVAEVEQDYSKNEVMELLATVSEGISIVFTQNERQSAGVDRRKGLIERASDAFGLLGAVRFLEGYYLLVVTKARIVATIGYHEIYKIEEVILIPLAIEGIPVNNPDELRYLKLFQSVDLSTDFYFSYIYDLSRTLQENVLEISYWSSCNNLDKKETSHFFPDSKFIWNSYLLEPLRKSAVSEKWFIEVVHGYVGQQIIELPCSRLSLTLIGRRSVEYAGTRYLKRGANFKGQVANDVETEQIIWDTRSSPNFKVGKFSSFVQRRGSVPLIWSQDPATRGVVGKPVISIDINEPHAQTAAAHFRELRKKYGNPLIVMNLVKRRENRRHEALLHDQFLKAVKYLNMFLPKAERIAYLSFDVASCHKTGNVLNKLEEIAFRCVVRLGWFQSFPLLYCRKLRPTSLLNDFEPLLSADGKFLLQHGVFRTNCVDCLDRTNVAQFGIGKVSLGLQLYSMGLAGEPLLSPTSEVCRMYEDLMDQHGNTLALQYAGSQLVHSIKTYKKISVIQERSRDVIQTLSRYYSNTFGDYDKQNAINLFLGVFRPSDTKCHLWDLGTDHYLHFPVDFKTKADYCAWFIEPDYWENSNDWKYTDSNVFSTVSLAPPVPHCHSFSAEDLYYIYYRLWELSRLDDLIREQKDLQKSVMVDGVNQSIAHCYSFAKLWKQDLNDKSSVKQEKTPLSDDDDEEDEPLLKSDTEVHYECGFSSIGKLRLIASANREITLNQKKPRSRMMCIGIMSTKEAYGFEVKKSTDADMAKYIQYAQLGGCTGNSEDSHLSGKPRRLSDSSASAIPDYSRLKPLSFFKADSVYSVSLLPVSKASMKIYNESVKCVWWGPKTPSQVDLEKYGNYALKMRSMFPLNFQIR